MTVPDATSPASILLPPEGAFSHHFLDRSGRGLQQLPGHAIRQLSSTRINTWIHPHNAQTRTHTTVEHNNPLEALGRLMAPIVPGVPGNAWAGWLSYDLAAWIEPGVIACRAGPSEPLAMVQRVDLASRGIDTPPRAARAFGRTVLRSQHGREAYKRAVSRALGYIRAGDIYQANIAHRFAGRFSGSPADLFASLALTAKPMHGLGLVFPIGASSPITPPGGGATPSPEPPAQETLAVLSLSPELFLSYDAPTRRITTRPMKGTRPGDADPRELRDAEKDRAELAMIVDLMRNDLGRVCEFGSVRVDDPRAIERHASGPGAVLQATATVSGTVRPGLSTAEILTATFPPGSVTGTPKLRAMQIIDELEPFARGPYCGCLGLFHDNGSFELAVAIRTLVIRGRTRPGTDIFDDAILTYCVGAGIVADSDPESEWLETLDKARVLEPTLRLQTE